MPAVGDWVAVVDAPGDHVAIEALLPRRTKVSRKTPWLKAEEHILVANVDMVFLVSGLDQDFNPRRLERYLTAAWDSGADPVIVLTKLDVCADFEKLAEAESVAVGVPVLAVSNVTGEGIDEVRALLQPAHTFVLLGSSGTGKSTLVNRLAGRTVMPTGDLRADGRGRHTTRHRQLLVLRDGAILIDTPGLRELQIWEGDNRRRLLGRRRARVTVSFQRLRALDRAGLRGARSPRDGRARSCALGQLREAPAGAACDRGAQQHARASRAQAALEGTRA